MLYELMSSGAHVPGDRKYGVPVLDPMLIKQLTTKHGGLTATSRNSTVVGVKDVVIEDIRYCVQNISKLASASDRDAGRRVNIFSF
jgi:hypothetical protein